MSNIEIIILKALAEVAEIYEYTIGNYCREFEAFYKYTCTGFCTFSPVYPFTNENIAEYYKNFDFKDKSILTVLGSGDHVLNAILLGAKEIDCFDISVFTYFYFDLKRAAIKALTYEEFLDFFVKGFNLFNIKLYSKIYRYLTPESKLFWDNLYLEFDDYEIRNSELFDDNFPEEYEDILKINPYLNKKNYYKLKKMIDNCEIRFFNSDILSLKMFCKEGYDFIGLSNIYGRVTEEGSKRLLEEQIIELSNLLYENGVIIINYNWGNYYDLDLSYLTKILGELKAINIGGIESFNSHSHSILYYKNTELKREL